MVRKKIKIITIDYVYPQEQLNEMPVAWYYPANTERFENVFRRFLFGPLRPKRF